MQFPFSQPAQFAIIAVGSTIAFSIGSAQGPAPSPLLPQPAPAPGKAIVAPTQPSPAPALTREDLEAFLDGLISSQLQNRNMAGAVVAVVKDGQVLLQKGYGYADFAGKKQVLAESTLFRPGSISKLFTAVAVMQLVEQGKLDLDRDVNEYLDFQIRKSYPEPITLRHLLTHTAGFEETLKNLFVPSAAQMKPLHDYLVAAMPAQIYPPGKIPAYSNYGVTVAGYIVQRISGKNFEAYITDHILKPLGMNHSTFEQPLPPALASQMSNGYSVATKPAKDFEFVQAAPAGSLSTTAADMTRFMLAILQGGTLEGNTILSPASLQTMLSRQFGLHPALNGLGLVFFDYSTNGHRIVGHGGDTLWFHSDVYIFSDAQVGLFISYNSAGLPMPTTARSDVERAFLDRYFPDTRTLPKPVDAATAKKDRTDATGVYEVTRRAETTLLKIASFAGQSAVKADREGVLTVEDVKNQRGELKKWQEIGPLIYREIDGPGMLAFRRDTSGEISEILPQLPLIELQRVPWYENKKFVYPILVISLAVPLVTILFWPVAAIIRKRYHQPLFSDRANRLIYFLARLICLLEVGYLILIAVLASRAGEDVALLGSGLDPWLTLIHVVGWIIAMGTIFLVVSAVRFWRASQTGWWTRVHCTLLALSAVVFTVFAWNCHLLGNSMKF